MRADLVTDRPLLLFLAGFGAEDDLFLAPHALGPATRLLAVIQPDDHAQVALGQGDGVDRRPGHPRRREQLLDDPIDDAANFFAGKILTHETLGGKECRPGVLAGPGKRALLATPLGHSCKR